MPFQGQERCSYLEVNSSPPRIIFPDCNPLTFQSCLGGLWMLLINLNKVGVAHVVRGWDVDLH
uniref:Uncharacterized protein n=1 Tax=Molossus molossus TaxID=27622 RepID=A0A7J8F8V6_MOLMO|nr:hypothetical protein HJG59_008497 [Molossus molossus]